MVAGKNVRNAFSMRLVTVFTSQPVPFAARSRGTPADDVELASEEAGVPRLRATNKAKRP